MSFRDVVMCFTERELGSIMRNKTYSNIGGKWNGIAPLRFLTMSGFKNYPPNGVPKLCMLLLNWWLSFHSDNLYTQAFRESRKFLLSTFDLFHPRQEQEHGMKGHFQEAGFSRPSAITMPAIA